MNGPRKKEPVELAWSAIKRAITARVNYDMQVEREHRLNDALDEAWKEFKTGLDQGQILGPSDDALEALSPGGTA